MAKFDTSAMTGRDFENAYAQLLGGRVSGGFDDHGMDVVDLTIPNVPAVQIKASVTGARKFLAESVRRKQFIPICVGEPGSKSEMIHDLECYGAWIGKEVPNRRQILTGVAQVRAMCR